MSHESFPIHIKDEHLPNAGFFQWIKSNSALFLGQIAALISVILYIGTFSYYVIGHDPNSPKLNFEDYLYKAESVLFLLNIVFSIVFVVTGIFILGKKGDGTDQVKLFYSIAFNKKLERGYLFLSQKQLHLAKKIILAYWAYILAYYLIRLLTPQSEGAGDEKEVTFQSKNYLSFLLGNIMMVILYMYFAIMMRSNKIKYPFVKTDGGKRKQSVPFILRMSAPLVFYAVMAILPFLYNCGIIHLELDVSQWYQLMRLITGIVNMIILSVLISRLDSKLIGISSWLISIMYVYAAIQPLDIAFGGKDILSKSISVSNYAIAFLFKIYFFLILTYIMQTGRMLSFFCCNGEMSKRLHESRINR